MCKASEAFNWYVLQSPSVHMKEQDKSYICFYNTLNIQGDKMNYFLKLTWQVFFLNSDRVQWMINSSSCCCKVQECKNAKNSQIWEASPLRHLLTTVLKCFAKSLSWDSSVSQVNKQGRLLNLLRWLQPGCLCSRVVPFNGKTQCAQSQKYQCNLQGMLNESSRDSLHLPCMLFQILEI